MLGPKLGLARTWRDARAARDVDDGARRARRPLADGAARRGRRHPARSREGSDWYTPAPESRLRVIGLFVGADPRHRLPQRRRRCSARPCTRARRSWRFASSLGAGRLRLLRQLLVEHLLLAALGGVARRRCSERGWRAGSRRSWPAGSRRAISTCRPDLNVVLFTVAVSLVVAAAIGVLPALAGRASTCFPLFRARQRGCRACSARRGLWWLIPWQVALGTVLLASAGLLAKTVQHLKHGIAGVGARARVVRRRRVRAICSGRRPHSRIFRNALPHLQTLPGVEVAAFSSGRPLASIRRGRSRSRA